jgi:hypothetical protein
VASVIKNLRQGNGAGRTLLEKGVTLCWDLPDDNEKAMRRPRGREFQAEGIASTKALRWEGTWCGWGLMVEIRQNPVRSLLW